MQIAEVFVAANVPQGSSWSWECAGPSPDKLSPDHKRGKTVIKWNVTVRWKSESGGVVDGDSIVHVNIETKEAHWMQSP
jgi:hypothetical protein